MDVVYYAARANLRRWIQVHPDWKQQPSVQATGMSLGWVKKWRKRLREAPAEDEHVLQGLWRARKHPPEHISETVVDRMLEIGDQPPEGLQRTPGRHQPAGTICLVTPGWWPKANGRRVRVAPSRGSYAKPDVSPSGCQPCMTGWSDQIP